MSKFFLVGLSALAAGFVNGLLGTGGGIILIFALNKLINDEEGKDVYALTLAVTLVFSVISVVKYMENGTFELLQGVKYAFAAIPGGLAGAYLLDRLDGGIVKKMFGVLLIVSGVNFAF